MYLVKTPWWLKKLYGQCMWQVPTDENVIYLTFDDGPHPVVTEFVLKELRNFNAQATFFCIGKNVQSYPDVYKRILADGHSVGNHTHNHLNGWKTRDGAYVDDIAEAGKWIDSKFFRPPYGRITRFQLKLIQRRQLNLKPVMWSVLSGDFDTSLSNEKCLTNVTKYATKGSIVVFHDSEKANEKLAYTLPKVLDFFSNKGYVFKKL
ncbi:MAG: polysaccharide deacetylase family protein [Bacteroidota bacterium]